MSELLNEDIKEVRLSTRLTDSACSLVSDEYDIAPSLQCLLQAIGRETPETKRILEVNPGHALLEKLRTIHSENADDARIAEYSGLLRDQALLAAGAPVKDPATFAQRLTALMVSG